jgi:hypothetical protein
VEHWTISGVYHPRSLARSKASAPVLLDVFEALYEAIGSLTERAYTVRNLASLYEERLNEALDTYRVATR